MDFQQSAQAQAYCERVRRVLDEQLLPREQAWSRHYHEQLTPWSEPADLVALREECRESGLWNLFLPDAELGVGLSHVDYASVAELTGRSALAPDLFNCNAPDTGNMEVLYHYGSESQKARWLTPLLSGEIRSAFAMTEPAVASSDATNMQATAVVEGDEVVLNGQKWWTTGIGHPRCELIIFMGLTDAGAPRHQRHSMVLVPRDAAGVSVPRLLDTFGFLDGPYGHGEVHFDNVRLPRDHIIAGPGRGFEIAQGRLGPGRIHHCMRLIGAAERAFELMCERGQQRVAFGKPLLKLGGNRERLAEARVAIDQARLLTLRAAWLIDRYGVSAAMSEISQIKLVAPRMALQVIDQAMQLHGGGGLSSDFPLAHAWVAARALRLADGPDEVHQHLIAREELKRQEQQQ